MDSIGSDKHIGFELSVIFEGQGDLSRLVLDVGSQFFVRFDLASSSVNMGVEDIKEAISRDNSGSMWHLTEIFSPWISIGFSEDRTTD